jgi:LAO/AO transport system kinase
VLTTSAAENLGIEELWNAVLAHQSHTEAGGHRLARRRDQAVAWLRELVTAGLGRVLTRNADVAALLATAEAKVGRFEASPVAAARDILLRYTQRP